MGKVTDKDKSTFLTVNARYQSKRTQKTWNGPCILGLLLLSAARLYRHLEFYTDERLLEEYLNADPPLHLRRTLNQYAKWGSKLEQRPTILRTSVGVDFEFPVSKRHLKNNRNLGNMEGRQNQQTGPERVLAVDQLWIWILDDSKYIRCY
jgi:hypothetical protein